jgi:hypothetical protein
MIFARKEKGKKMTLNECTREELIFVIKRLSWMNKSEVERALCDVEYERVKKKLAKAEEWGETADNWRAKYIELLSKCGGKPLIDIPVETIEEMEKCLLEAKKADEQYDKLMKEVDEYGKRTAD